MHSRHLVLSRAKVMREFLLPQPASLLRAVFSSNFDRAFRSRLSCSARRGLCPQAWLFSSHKQSMGLPGRPRPSSLELLQTLPAAHVLAGAQCLCLPAHTGHYRLQFNAWWEAWLHSLTRTALWECCCSSSVPSLQEMPAVPPGLHVQGSHCLGPQGRIGWTETGPWAQVQGRFFLTL